MPAGGKAGDWMIARSFSLGVAGTTLRLPCFFPSISSVKTNLSPLEYLQTLVATRHPLFLISAYDLHRAAPRDRSTFQRLLEAAHSRAQIVLLDSGNYESYWHRDGSWTPRKLSQILKKIKFHMGFCFDNQSPPRSVRVNSGQVERAVLREQAASATGTIVPIVHAEADKIPEVSRRVVESLRPMLIAVAERRLGEGIVDRANTIFKIRRCLNRAGYYCPLHVLGTGSPLSILAYSACGADSFDGLEWCQTTVDHHTGRPYHFHQWDFFASQTAMGRAVDTPYAIRVLVHNLVFYQTWMREIQEALQAGRVLNLLSKYLPGAVTRAIRNHLRGRI